MYRTTVLGLSNILPSCKCRFLTSPHPGLAIYRNCVELELNLASAGDKSCLQNVRKLYESALATYSQDARLWQDYYSTEIKVILALSYMDTNYIDGNQLAKERCPALDTIP